MKSISKKLQRALKRLLDVTFSFAFLILFSPLIILIIVMIFITMGRPIFFVQRRPGHNELPFNLRKFRTMSDLRSKAGELLPDEFRMTKFGKFLRSTSLDEIPQLFNILRGEMSLVGPRPLLIRYLDLYSQAERRRHEVTPGITGWAQVNGRNAISWKQKFELDVWYVENWSLLLDLKILFLTVIVVVRRRGVSSDGHAAGLPFDGTN